MFVHVTARSFPDLSNPTFKPYVSLPVSSQDVHFGGQVHKRLQWKLFVFTLKNKNTCVLVSVLLKLKVKKAHLLLSVVLYKYCFTRPISYKYDETYHSCLLPSMH